MRERLLAAMADCAGECPNDGTPENLKEAAEVIRPFEWL